VGGRPRRWSLLLRDSVINVYVRNQVAGSCPVIPRSTNVTSVRSPVNRNVTVPLDRPFDGSARKDGHVRFLFLVGQLDRAVDGEFDTRGRPCPMIVSTFGRSPFASVAFDVDLVAAMVAVAGVSVWIGVLPRSVSSTATRLSSRFPGAFSGSIWWTESSMTV